MSFVNVDVMRLFIVLLFSIALMLDMPVIGVIPVFFMRIYMIIFHQFGVKLLMLVNGLFLFDRMNGMFHLADLLNSLMPDMSRIELMIVYFLTLFRCLLYGVRIVRYIQLNIMLVSSIVLHVIPNSMPLLDNWCLLLFAGMMSSRVVVFCPVLRLVPQFPLSCISNGNTAFLFVILFSLILHMRSSFR